MAKIALLIGVSDYEPGLDPLPAAVKDVAAMQAVLAHPEMGEFAADDVKVLPNPDRQTMENEIYKLFTNRQKDDLVLLYFSGHGVLDDSADFYFATRSTRKDQGKLVPPTAVSARTVQAWMEQSRSQRQVIILDSCFSGAFAKGVKAKDGGSVNLEQYLGGKGRAILTASTSTQYALTQDEFDLSVYTHYLVEGIRTGGADQDDDGMIAVEELHAYASGKVREAAPSMTPEFYPVKDGYKILLAKSPKDDPKLKYRKQVEAKAREGRITIPGRRHLDSLRTQWGIEKSIAEAIEAEVLQPYREYQRKVLEYEETLIAALQDENPLSQRTLDDLQDYQQHLALLDSDVEPINQKHLGQGLRSSNPAASADSIEMPTAQYFEFDVLTVNRQGQEQLRTKGRAEFRIEDLGDDIALELVRIPGGTFLMGTADADRDTIIQEMTRYGISQKDAEEWTSREIPQHSVTVPEFWMGKFAVTQAQWQQIAGFPKVNQDLNEDPAKFKGPMRPVERVSWDDAVEFCARLSQQSGKRFRLPSEAEWEYACRAGTTTPFYFGPTITPDLVNYDGNHPYGDAPKGEYRQQTTNVGSFMPNTYGLYDIHGNIWEWCADSWYDNYNNAPNDGSARTNNSESRRLLRGGSWIRNAVYCRCADRFGYTSDNRYTYIGFRVAVSFP